MVDRARSDRDRWLQQLLAHWSPAGIDTFRGYPELFAADLSDSLTNEGSHR